MTTTPVSATTRRGFRSIRLVLTAAVASLTALLIFGAGRARTFAPTVSAASEPSNGEPDAPAAADRSRAAATARRLASRSRGATAAEPDATSSSAKASAARSLLSVVTFRVLNDVQEQIDSAGPEAAGNAMEPYLAGVLTTLRATAPELIPELRQ